MQPKNNKQIDNQIQALVHIISQKYLEIKKHELEIIQLEVQSKKKLSKKFVQECLENVLTDMQEFRDEAEEWWLKQNLNPPQKEMALYDAKIAEIKMESTLILQAVDQLMKQGQKTSKKS